MSCPCNRTGPRKDPFYDGGAGVDAIGPRGSHFSPNEPRQGNAPATTRSRSLAVVTRGRGTGGRSLPPFNRRLDEVQFVFGSERARCLSVGGRRVRTPRHHFSIDPLCLASHCCAFVPRTKTDVFAPECLRGDGLRRIR